MESLSKFRDFFSFQILFEFIILIIYVIYSYIHLMFRFVFPPKLKSLDGEIFLITGAASGIGKETVFHLATKHPKTTLVLWDSNEKANQETFEGVKLLGVKVFCYTVDITDRLQVEKVAEQVTEEVGIVTILFNNAGIAGLGEFLSLSAEKIEKIIMVNLVSHFWILKSLLPNMIESNHGHIITTCSGAGFAGVRHDAPYSASKFGVRGYLESIKSELRHHPLKPNIKFTTIFPSFVRTPLISRVRIQMKMPYLFKPMEPRYVAEKIIDGVRKNQESVFLPPLLEFALLFKGITPKRVIDSLEDFFIERVSFVEEN